LAIGKRDYAMFSLMTTYGIRACDVVALTLDDIEWRAGHILIRQSKTGNPLELSLDRRGRLRDSGLSEKGPALWPPSAGVSSASRLLAVL
jgi:integrase